MPKPRQGEEREAFLDRCMGDSEAVSDYPDRSQRFAVCTSFWDRRNNQADIDFTPPQGVRDAAKRGLEMHEEGKSGDGLEAGTVRIARKLAAGEAISEEQARKGNRFWGRNERFLSEPKDSPAYVSALLWGGRPGMSWYRKLFRQIEAREGKSNMSNGEQVRVNVTRKVNQGMITHRGEGDEREMVIRSVAAVDESILNGILYTRSELDASMETLDQTPAPLGHPVDALGDFMSARDVKAINRFYFGAYNENPRRDGNRIIVDKVINVKRAQENEMGRRVLDAVNRGDPIHTSTGLLCNIEECPDSPADFLARNILFDHDAILLDEPGAATPEDGVGMLVNKARDEAGNEISVINSFEDVEEALSEPQKVGLIHQITTAIKEALAPERKPETNSSEVDMSDKDKTKVDDVSAPEIEAKEAVVNEMTEDKIRGMVKSMINEYMDEKMPDMMNRYMKDMEKQKAEGKRNSLVDRVVNKNLLDEEVAKVTPIPALEAMLNHSGDNYAAPIHGGFNVNSQKPEYELPEE